MIPNVHTFSTCEVYCSISIHFEHVGSCNLANCVILIKPELKDQIKAYVESLAIRKRLNLPVGPENCKLLVK